jgi:hypothetical protein
MRHPSGLVLQLAGPWRQLQNSRNSIFMHKNLAFFELERQDMVPTLVKSMDFASDSMYHIYFGIATAILRRYGAGHNLGGGRFTCSQLSLTKP